MLPVIKKPTHTLGKRHLLLVRAFKHGELCARCIPATAPVSPSPLDRTPLDLLSDPLGGAPLAHCPLACHLGLWSTPLQRQGSLLSHL